MELEKRRVHIAKTLTWRFLATSTTIVIAFAITGSVAAGAAIGGIEAAAKMVLYYGHERAWAVGLANWRAAHLGRHREFGVGNLKTEELPAADSVASS